MDDNSVGIIRQVHEVKKKAKHLKTMYSKINQYLYNERYFYLQVFARKETLIKHRMSCPTEAATQNSVTRVSVPCPICKLQLQSLSSLHEHIDTHYCNGMINYCKVTYAVVTKKFSLDS